ncbi:ATP/GTP-binding protein [Litorihabitans aurantiacus]|uniref:ATP/GTP-binding protein n=1 Tax=Litorihabitans aurantiacus TaxID=1930061 RepID=UPI0024E10AA1|nr:ATP/GTP-binding protein [Litorihabitans aurantiacus]
MRAPRVPSARGWLGAGAGADTTIQVPASFRGTTVQVCGLHPFAVGDGTSMLGVPLGVHEHTSATVCADPMSWFQGDAIGNPSVFVMGLPALGKTSLVARMCVGLAGYGVLPFVLGDTRPDYVPTIEALGGEVHRLGRNRDYINPLDPGESTVAAQRLRAAGFEREAQEVEADAHGRRLTTVLGLIAIQRKGPTTEAEEAVLDRALHIVDARLDRVPIMSDVLDVVREGPDELRAAVIDRGSWEVYQTKTEGLELSLTLLSTTGFGGLFSRESSKPLQRDKPVVYDISAIPQGESDLLAAALLACWSNGFATVNIAGILADAGLEPRRLYFLVMDELHRILRAGGGMMVDRIDYLTRLNRAEMVGQAMITHTMKDLKALPESERLKAMGFIERSGMVILGGLPGAEMPDLTPVLPLTQEEQAKLASWATPPSQSAKEGVKQDPPGRGKFLIKVGGRPGIPIRVRLTQRELNLTNTNRKWQEVEAQRRAARAQAREAS